MSPEEERQRGLTRDRLVEAGLGLVQDEGLEGLTMRALADRLEVKAASLYWHVRDRRELLELLADSIMETVRLPRGGGAWRAAVLGIATALRQRVAAQADADRVLLEVPDSLSRSQTFDALARRFEQAGVRGGEARELARMVMVHVITAHPLPERPLIKSGGQASIAIDSGSRGVALRAGAANMQGLVAAAHGSGGAAPAIVRGETVIVRRLRGVGLGEIELNPHHPWNFKIQGPTWNTTLDMAGLDVRGIKLDSGAARAECFLPEPRGVVPIEISGGVVDVKLHRPQGAVVVAHISTGALRVKLDGYSLTAAVLDSQWESDAGGSVAPNRYQLRINGGAVQVSLDATAKAVKAPATEQPGQVSGEPVAALEILLDGVEARVRRRPPG